MKVKWQWNQMFKGNLIKEVLIWVIKMPTRGGGGDGNERDTSFDVVI
jgi:hypothetical protein